MPSTGRLYKPEEHEWRDQALCKGLQDLFFAPVHYGEDSKKEDGRHERIRKAKAICMQCPVLTECRDWLQREPLDHGVAGGYTANERRRMGWNRVTPLSR